MQPQDPALQIVTAVIVAHDGARWLQETVEAVREQTRPVQRVTGVDVGSRDRTGEILASYIAADAVTEVPRSTGFGDAVRAALALPRLREPFPGAAEGAREWIWLIHDDCTPAPDALEKLLESAAGDPRAAVLGPKLRDFYDRRLLVEAGVTIDGAGRRETGLEPREFDHGQHDGDRQVLAVSSAGMLVRRDVWDALGGFDPALSLFRDDIDFCWRVGSAGHRVVLATGAVAYHAEAAGRRRRPIAVGSGHPRRLDRRNALYVLLANLPFGGMVGALLRNAFGSALRVLMLIAAKQPAGALDEAVAFTSVLLRPARLAAARFRRLRNRKRTYSAIRPFLARGVALRQFSAAVVGLLSGDRAVGDATGRHQAVRDGGGTSPGSDDAVLGDEHGLLRRSLSRPGVLLVLALTAVALIGGRGLLAPGILAGGALAPVTGGASDLWDLFLSGAPATGIGADGPAPPSTGILAVLSTLAFGKPWLAVTAILLGCIPLAGLSAYLLARQVLHFRPAQLWMAGSYALLPVATGAIAQGRVGTALVHALLPVLGILGARMLNQPPKRSRRAAWGLGLLLAVATAFVPLVWLLAVAVGAVVALTFGHLGRRLYVSIGIAVGAPLLLLLPWSAELLVHPSLWLTEYGLHGPELSAPGAAAHELLMLSPGGTGTPPAWVTAGFLTASLAALLLLRRRMMIAVGWSIALFGVAVAILVSRIWVEPAYGGPEAPGWPGVALAFAATALLLTAAVSAHSFGVLWSAGGLRRLFAGGAAVLALSTPVGAAGAWMWNGADGPLRGGAGPAVPGQVAAAAGDPAAATALVLRPTAEGPLRYALLRPGEPRTGAEQIGADATAGGHLSTAVASLAAGRGGSEVGELAFFGVGSVVVPRPDAGGDADVTLVDTLDGTPGLDRRMLNDEFGLWRVSGDPGRLRILPPPDGSTGSSGTGTDSGVDTASGSGGGPDGGAAEDAGDPDGPVALEIDPDGETAAVPEGESGRTLALAEPFAAGWTATLDGEELRPAESRTGTTLFPLPAGGGTVALEHSSAVRDTWLAVQLLLIATALVLASPGARTPDDDRRAEEIRAAARPRRPRGTRRKGGRGA